MTVHVISEFSNINQIDMEKRDEKDIVKSKSRINNDISRDLGF